MAKKTAIIDLGSNGIRMAIFEKTSRYGFYIINEQKVKFRLGQGTYDVNKIIQEKQINKACQIIGHFHNLAKDYKCSKIICVGTSALRDAINKQSLIGKLKTEQRLNIRILSGEQEAYLSGFGAINLLFRLDEDAICIDIGGGSVELCLVQNSKITDTFSLDIGTVRLKEIYDGKLNKLEEYLDKIIAQIPEKYNADKLITIGGSLRSISSAIMKKIDYPINQVHAFSYQLKEQSAFIEKIIDSKNSTLASFGIKKERFDTIKIGALIFLKIAKKLNSKHIITSGAGVREGIFLKDLFKHHKGFPKDFNPSLKSLEDRFCCIKTSAISKNSLKLFSALEQIHYVDKSFKFHLNYASRLCQIGTFLSYYSKHKHSSYLTLSGLNFCINHNDKALIATIIEQHGKKINYQDLKLKKLLPDENTVNWLNFILAFSYNLSKAGNNEVCDFELRDKKLYVYKKTSNFVLFDLLKKIAKPKKFDIFINNEELKS